MYHCLIGALGAICFAVLYFRRRNAFIGFGFSLVAIGGLFNGLAVSANGGKMPVLVTDEAVGDAVENSPIHCRIDENTRLIFLADRFDVGPWIISLGDILAATGLFTMCLYVIYSFCFWLTMKMIRLIQKPH